MVVSLDPISGRRAAASIPRDTVHFPVDANRITPKVNGLYQSTRNDAA